MRTLSEILKEADKADTVTQLNLLSLELYDNRQYYPEIEVTYGLEHMIEKAELLIAELRFKRLNL